MSRGTLIITGGFIPIVRRRPGHEVSLRELGKEIGPEEAFTLARKGGVMVTAFSEGPLEGDKRFFVAEQGQFL